ncbi:hypothetical protein OH77DRAFT_1286688 [Trametes cingulata]|nr:hypothetical protein OH77DRAFT_1286688 [Trametes cingulata]
MSSSKLILADAQCSTVSGGPQQSFLASTVPAISHRLATVPGTREPHRDSLSAQSARAYRRAGHMPSSQKHAGSVTRKIQKARQISCSRPSRPLCAHKWTMRPGGVRQSWRTPCHAATRHPPKPAPAHVLSPSYAPARSSQQGTAHPATVSPELPSNGFAARLTRAQRHSCAQPPNTCSDTRP